MKQTLLMFSFIFSCLFAFSQTNGFYAQFENPEGKTWKVGDVLETENGFLFSLRDQTSPVKVSKVVKMSSEGILLGEMSLAATDTIVNLCSLFPSFVDSGYVEGWAVCTTLDDDAMLLKLRIDGELNEISRSLAPLPSADSVDYWLDDYRFLQAEDGCFALLSYRSLTGMEIKLCRISSEGNVTQVERMEDSLVAYVANMFHVHDNPNGFGIFIQKRQVLGTHVNSCAMLYDDNLQLKGIYDITNWYEDDGLGNVYSGSLSLYNSMVCPSPDGGYYISSRLDESTLLSGTVMEHDQSSVLAKTDSVFHTYPQYCVVGHLNDTVEVPSFYRSVDVNDEGMVYQCSMQNIKFGSWPYGSNGTHLVVTKTDTDLNVLWQKRFLKDGNIYSAFQTIATSDGGCLVIGNVYDHNPERCQDVFALKINAEGTVGLDEIQEENMTFVYPNPAKEIIRIGGTEAKETQVFNTLGQCVMSFCGNEASVSNLPTGVYLLRVANNEDMMQTLRLVIDK